MAPLRNLSRVNNVKFNIKTNGQAIDVFVIEQALIKADSAAMIDIDRNTSQLRISTCLDDTALLNLIAGAGFPIPAANLQGVPSDCCGGCSG